MSVVTEPSSAAPGGAAPAAEVADLVKRYPKRPVDAVRRLSFSVARGEVFGLLGPNGAGKTTTVGVLTTRVRATSGRAWVAGIDVAADPAGARARLAVVPQRANLDRSLSAVQNLTFHAAYHGVPRATRNARAAELLDQFGLGDRGADKVDRYSGGQAQRLMIARALMHAPEVLFLDEPSTGLDPHARLFVWDRIRDLARGGVTVVLTTHDMDEATALCGRVGIVDNGSLLALDTPEALTRSLPGTSSLEVTAAPAAARDGHRDGGGSGDVDGGDLDGGDLDGGGSDAAAVAAAVRRLPGVTDVEPAGVPDGQLRLRVFVDAAPASLLGPVTETLTAHGARVTDVAIREASLEDVFISLTGRGLR